MKPDGGKAPKRQGGIHRPALLGPGASHTPGASTALGIRRGLSSVIWPSICNLHCRPTHGRTPCHGLAFRQCHQVDGPYPLAGVFAHALLTGYIHSMTNSRSTFKHAMETRSRIKISARLEPDSVPPRAAHVCPSSHNGTVGPARVVALAIGKSFFHFASLLWRGLPS
jgi:hypothetical protein